MKPRNTGSWNLVHIRPREVLFCFLLMSLLLPGIAGGQVIPDSVRVRPDSLGVLPDSLEALDADPELREGQEALGDTISPQDTLPAATLPPHARAIPSGFHTGVWSWDREEILGSRAVNLAELVAQVPGAVPLRGGDYGQPTTVSAFGAGGGRIRVFRDGVEVPALDGSTVDLSRMMLGGIQEVRVVRAVGEVRIELESLLSNGGRPYSLVEAGTGDLATNIFRGTFAHPRAMDGVIALALDRVDTRGPMGQEAGFSAGAWIRYARALGSRGVVVADYSSVNANRGDLYSPEQVKRADWTLRTRWNLIPGLVGDLFYGSSSLGTKGSDVADPDAESPFDFGLEARTRFGTIVSYESQRIRALGRVQKNSGEGIPETSAFLEVSGGHEGLGGIAGELEWEDWGEEAVSRNRIRAWTAPFRGISFFGERGSGKWGLPYLPDLPPPAEDSTGASEEGDETSTEESPSPVLPGPRFAEHSGTRIGATLQWRDVSFSGARLSMTSDSLFPLGLASDRDGETRVGGTRNGFEVAGRVPLYPKGMALVGSVQWWDQAPEVWSTPTDSTASEELDPVPAAEDRIPWRYLPTDNYQASLSFHDIFFPTGNLEVWFDLGVMGRNPMVIPQSEELEGVLDDEGEQAYITSEVPFAQSWFVRLQIRVVSVRIFFMWENLTTRMSNQDFPGRVLPHSRSVYGIRWTMWN